MVLSASTLSACATPAGPAAPSTPAVIKRIVLPKHPTVYFFGDSWTHGASADPGRGFPQVVGQAMGWKVKLGPDNSGAGYVNTYNPAHPIFPEKVKQLPPIRADLVILQGGLNDIPGSKTRKLWDPVRATVKTLKKKAGGAPIIMVGPTFPNGQVPPGIGGINWEEQGVAKEMGIPYISPVNEVV